MPFKHPKQRLFLLCVASLLMSFCSSKRRLDESIVLTKNGAPLAGALVMTNITGRNLHWWDDPTISGDWQTPQSEIMGMQETISTTDENGMFHVQGKGVHLNIIVFDDLKGHVVYSSEMGFLGKIPTRLELNKALSIFPISAFGAHTAVKKLEENASLLFVSVQLPGNKPAHDLPYEVFFHGTKTSFLKFVTDRRGYIHILVPSGSSYDVILRPEESTWPGLDPYLMKVPEALKNDQETIDRVVRENPNLEYERNDSASGFWKGYKSFDFVEVRAPKPYKGVKLSNLKPIRDSAQQTAQEIVILDRQDALGKSPNRGPVIPAE